MQVRFVVRWMSFAGDFMVESECGWYHTRKEADAACEEEKKDFEVAAQDRHLAETTFWVQAQSIDAHGNRTWL